MKKAVGIESLLEWRRQRAEAEAPAAPSGAHLLKLVQPWWKKWLATPYSGLRSSDPERKPSVLQIGKDVSATIRAER